ncbi:PHP domain-containing protein [Candidatus Cloacimonadota bacterium]
MHWFKADLHIHSVLSPCGGLEMGPLAVMSAAREKNLDIIAITDHNSTGNLTAYSKVAEDLKITFIPGIEVQSVEEIHIIALFHNLNDAHLFSHELYKTLLPVENDPEFFGDQVLVDAEENITGYEPRALINSSSWTFEEVMENVLQFNGFAFPAHIDAESYSVIGQLGFLPRLKEIVALGITAGCDVESLLGKFPYIKKYTLLRNSDAHYIKDIGSGYTDFFLNEPSLEEIILACSCNQNRKIKI